MRNRKKIELVKCPYCNEEQKKITTNHLKKHNIAYIDYLKEYEKDKYYVQVVTEFIWDFYKPCSNKYIEQVLLTNSRKYGWLTKYAMGKNYLDSEIENAEKRAMQSNKLIKLNNTRPFPFSKSDIMKHLRQETTVGIYSVSEKSSFLTFDIDEDNLNYVESIYNNLRCFGIEDNQILMSYSGNKGYHITIFFNYPISKARLRKLFNLILRESNLLGNKRENGSEVIEARGVSDQGVKLPLSINRKNKVEYRKINNWEDWEQRQTQGKGNYCFLTNEYGCEIDTLEKIIRMQKIDSGKVLEIINDFDEELTFEYNIDGATVKEFKELTDEVNLQAFGNNINEINASIKAKLEKPIEAKERNKTLLQIAVFNKSQGMTAEENEKFLISFSADKKHKFETSLEENIKEIKAMIKTIYYSDTANKYKIATGIKDLVFKKNEILEILTVKEKPIRKLYFVMFTHFKLYGDKNTNQFFMKYERIRRLLNIDGKTINKGLIQLEKLNKITFVRKGERDEESLEYRNLANIYTLVYEVTVSEVDKGYKLLCGKEENKSHTVTYVNFEMMCAKALSKDEIKKYFVNSAQILKYKYQKLQEIS